ncbi:MAG: cobalamin biosynthesis protein CobD [Curvibacter sp.]|nr:cobalamin biosynthesis protein CobD [Curvibacter sp.]
MGLEALGAAGLAAVVPIGVALWLDRSFGEPPAMLHPVVWMGRYLGRVGAWLAPGPAQRARVEGRVDGPRLAAGAVLWLLGAVPWVALAWALQHGLARLSPWLGAVVLGGLLKPLLAWRMLRDEVRAVEAALAASLEQGRARLAWLVSRDVSRLDAAQVRESAIESLAENFNDSVLAPLFWFAVAGLPGAALYRYANTADAMWGYPGWRGEGAAARYWAWAGKWAARVDDGLSWLPARLSAWLLLGTARAPGGGAWGLGAEARRTPSPNSGWPMAAMALRLGLRLGKPGVYQLNAQGRAPGPEDVARAIELGRRALLSGAVVMALLALLCRALGEGPWSA